MSEFRSNYVREECAECGKKILENEAYQTDYGILCEDCHNELYTRCDNCGNEIEIDASNCTNDGNYICDDCYDELYTNCHNCGEELYINNSCSINGWDYCTECFSELFIICDDCGMVIDRDLSYYDEEIDDYLCSDCWENHSNEIEEYNHTTYDLHFRSVFGEMTRKYFGIEIEVDDGNENEKNEVARDIKALFDNCFIHTKKDGSLNEGGFEIVTEPFTMEYIKTVYPKVGQAIELLKNADYKSHYTNTCGYHIHVSKAYFENWELASAKIIILFDTLWNDFVKFSRRDYSELNDWAKKNNVIKRDEDYDTVRDTIYESGCDRYHALNIINYNTIEFRLFKGTLNINTITATLQMVNYLTDYVEKYSLQDIMNISTWGELFDGLYSESKVFENYCKKVKIEKVGN